MTAKEWKDCQDELLKRFDQESPEKKREIVTLMLLKLAFISEFITTDMKTTIEILEKLEICP